MSELALSGLNHEQVATREQKGLTNAYKSRASRTVSQIIRANLFTLFNAILLACLVVTAFFGDWPDLVFGIVMIVNALTGIFSEIRAKMTLDRMSILDAAPILALRNGQEVKIPPDQIVLDDVLLLKLGDQVPADCLVLETSGFRVNESNLTGESVPQYRKAGEKILSGSAVVSGQAYVKTVAVGADSWANKMSNQVKRFQLAYSELQNSIDRVLKLVSWCLPVMIVILLSAQVRQAGGLQALLNQNFSWAIVAVVAGIVGMIPQGLVLMTSINFAAASVTLAKRGVLVQELPAVEVLARVNTLCLDKTGTLTTGQIVSHGFISPTKFAQIMYEDEPASSPPTDASPDLGKPAKPVANKTAPAPAPVPADSAAFTASSALATSAEPSSDPSGASASSSHPSAPSRAFPELAGADSLAPDALAVLHLLSRDRANATAQALDSGIAQGLGLWAENRAKKPKLGAIFSHKKGPEQVKVGRFPAQLVDRLGDYQEVAFDSQRKWSAIVQADKIWVLGAPEIVIGARQPLVDHYAQQGARVVVLGMAKVTADEQAALRASLEKGGQVELPTIQPVTYAILGEALRPDAAQTLEFFRQKQVDVIVISGDNPKTVAALAGRVGLDSAGYDARELPVSNQEMAQLLRSEKVFGRVTPDQKRSLVKALQSDGRTVAMTGDGVNDALALKDADLGVAMGNAASATKAAAKVVLVDSKFSTLPAVLREGRRVLANMERVSTLFLSKTTYAAVIAFAVGILGVKYPYLPRQFTLIGSITIGIPAFFLALAPSNRPYRPGFLDRVKELVIPVGIICGVSSIAAYVWANAVSTSSPSPFASSVATITLAFCALTLLAVLAQPLRTWRGILVIAMAVIVLSAIFIPFIRRFFALIFPDLQHWMIIGSCAVLGMVLIAMVGTIWHRKHW